MAFNTDIMQEVYPPDVVPESSISHSLLYIIHYIIDDEYTIDRQCC